MTGDQILVQYLDINISIDYLKYKLKLNLNIKPPNTFLYLKTYLKNPTYIFNNTLKSIFIRICKDYIDYLCNWRNILSQLLSRGYKFEHLCNTIKYR